MSETEPRPDVVYRGRRGAWVTIVLLVLLTGGMAFVCWPVWDVVSGDDEWISSDSFPLILLPPAVLAGSLFCMVLAAWRARQGRPRLILSGKN